MYYRAIRDIDPSKLLDFYPSPGKTHTLGPGMYFSLKYEFAKIFAQAWDLKSIAFIGEYAISNLGHCLHLDWNDGKISRLENFESYDSVLIDGRELCLKKKVSLDLVSFSIISKNEEAKAIYDLIQCGELISENELKSISPEHLSEVSAFYQLLP